MRLSRPSYAPAPAPPSPASGSRRRRNLVHGWTRPVFFCACERQGEDPPREFGRARGRRPSRPGRGVTYKLEHYWLCAGHFDQLAGPSRERGGRTPAPRWRHFETWPQRRLVAAVVVPPAARARTCRPPRHTQRRVPARRASLDQFVAISLVDRRRRRCLRYRLVT